MDFNEVPSFTTLQENIKRIRPETWKAVNDIIIQHAFAEGVEDGKRVRIDTTGVKTDIHHPADSHQLWDSIRVLARTLERAEEASARVRGISTTIAARPRSSFSRSTTRAGKTTRNPCING